MIFIAFPFDADMQMCLCQQFLVATLLYDGKLLFIFLYHTHNCLKYEWNNPRFELENFLLHGFCMCLWGSCQLVMALIEFSFETHGVVHKLCNIEEERGILP